MNTLALALAILSLIAVITSWLTYLRSIPLGGVAARPMGHLLTQATGIACAATAVATAPSAYVVIPAATSLLLGFVFVGLLSQRKTPLGDLKVAVGEPLSPFQCQDSDGVPFDTASLHGQRTLLKFFRGAW